MKILIKILIVMVLGGVLFLLGRFLSDTHINSELGEKGVDTHDISTLPLFTKGLTSIGIELDEIGHHSFSPDGRYFVFTGIKDSDSIPAKTFLAKISTGEVTPLPGILLRGFEDSQVVVLFKDNDLLLYDTALGTVENISTDGNIFAGSLSPDGRKYVFNTLKGVVLYNRDLKKTISISTDQFDGATAWFDDSIHILGFKDTGKKIGDAGNARQLGSWNIDSKNFTPLESNPIPIDSIRNVTWIVPGTVARVNTGWDDSSHDYLVNIKTGNGIDLGDTSSALMGGMKDEPRLGLFAHIMGYASDKDTILTTSLYRGLNKVTSTILTPRYIREHVQIVDQDSVLYIRKYLSLNQTISNVALVELNFKTKEERIIKDLELNPYNFLSFDIHQKIWVVSSKNKFFMGKLNYE